MRIGALLNPTTYVVTGLRQITMSPTLDMGNLDAISLWICFLVVAVFAALGMGLALKAFKASIK
jgi:ABC-type polysaccharide/polyol phosphate export permease